MKTVLVLCGAKGNGGDGFVVGRYLLNKGINVDVFLISDSFSPECRINHDKFKGNIYHELPNLNNYDLLVDALIGVGLERDLSDKYIDIINKCNDSKKTIVALDIPTGINSTTGISHKAYMKSDLCITVEYIKTGLLLEDGKDSYNRLEIIKIGMIKPTDIINIADINMFKDSFPKRLLNTNKGSYGKAAIIAGSNKYAGASLLSYNALCSFMMGVGYQYLYVPKSLIAYYKLAHPELIVNELDEVDGHIKYNELELNNIMKCDSISIGMGMDISIDLYNTIKYLLENYTGTLIIDADGLNTISKYGVDILLNKKCECILTPHIGEFVRLTNIPKNELMLDTINIAKEFAKKYGINLILKSSSSIITDGFNVIISAVGNTGLAKAGSGDTLSGILAGVSAYTDLPLIKKCALSSYILGRSCEMLDICEESITASQISNNIPNVIKEIKNI